MARKRTRKSAAPQRKRHDPEARRNRILDVAIRLAEEGGFDNVRQRDVAEQAGVALGTLYKSFKGKEDLLSAALQRETEALEQRLARRPVTGASAADRAGSLFQTLTRALLRKPAYARALLRAMTAGKEVAGHVVAHQTGVTRMVLAALRGRPAHEGELPTEDELTAAVFLQQIWFAMLVGWSAGLNGQAAVSRQVYQAAKLLLAGQQAQQT